MAKWRYIDTGPGQGVMNMALDEAIMDAIAQDLAPPTLRIYGWSPPAISLGYFQRFTQEINQERCRESGVDIVRRPTGGRAVLHQYEVTYSLLFKEGEGPGGGILASYKEISLGLLKGLSLLGVKAHMVPPSKGESTLRGACFDAPSWYEIAIDGKKLVGSAQVRRNNVVLQHGSILLDHDIDLLFYLLKPPGQGWSQIDKEAFAGKVISLKEIMGESPSHKEVAQALRKGISQVLEVDMGKGHLSDFEWELAQNLATGKYGSQDWLKRR
jgi:lipoate-protein ligase A